MEVAAFVTLSTRVCDDLRVWIEEARRQALLSEGQLLTLSDAADVITRATTTLTATGGEADTADESDRLEERASAAADEAGSAFLPKDRVLNPPEDS
jgi:hypothetical protein